MILRVFGPYVIFTFIFWLNSFHHDKVDQPSNFLEGSVSPGHLGGYSTDVD